MPQQVKYIVLFSFILISVSLNGQSYDTLVTYYDIDSLLLKEKIVVSEGNILNGKYESYFASGGKKVMGFYYNNKPDSLWEYYHENGKLKSAGHLKNGEKIGAWKHYFENGNLRMQGFMKGEKRNGNWKFYYENGEEKAIGFYHNNQKEKVWNYFFEDGKLKAQAFYKNGSGEYKELYPSGALKLEGFNSNQKSVGKWRYYYESGELEAEGFFKNGAKNGNWKYFHKNGNISAKGNFANGSKEGLWKYYYEDGQLYSEGIESESQKDGFWKLYYESGERKAEGEFQNGTGKYFEFYENGKQKSTGKVVKGKNEGRWIYFDELGNEEGYAIFRRGVGSYKGFYEDGTLRMEGTIENNKRVGIWKLYNQDTTLAGYYKPIYEEDRPSFKIAESFVKDEKFDKPEYRVKKDKVRFFKPKINEYKGYIISTNPLMSFLGLLPFAIEKYTQERLGYELTVSYLREPFFQRVSRITPESPYNKGFSFSFRQKLYHEDSRSGMFYFGHQITTQFLEHRATTTTPQGTLTASQNAYSYDLFIGTRWLKNPSNGGFTWDAYIGIGFGYQSFNRSFEGINVANDPFLDIDNSGLIVPIRFGLTFGYLSPRKKTSLPKVKP